jgi:aldehyde:ferredoxin oxidoreductase
MNGYAGKILRLDLSNRTFRIIDTQNYQHWFGGHGIGSAIFFDIMVKEKSRNLESIDGFSEQNIITIMAPPLCGTGVPGGSGRTEFQGIGVHSSPIGWFTRSDVGGRFASMLKFAGWDGIVLEGAANTPVWLDIRDGEVAVQDCLDLQLWGTDTHVCQQKIWDFVLEGGDPKNWHTPTGLQNKTTQKPAVLAIGPAGENKSRIAAIIHDSSHAVGEGGFGGIWGSKNLKAISVIGSGSIRVADPAALFQARLWQKAHYQFNLKSEEIEREAFPSDGHWVPPKSGDNWAFPTKKQGSRPAACVGCHSACRARYQSGIANEVKCFTSGFYPYLYANNSPEQQADIERRAGELSNLLGINSHELVYGIPYLNDLYQIGVLGPGRQIDCPLDFSTLGSYEFIGQLLNAIAYGNDGRGHPSPFGEALQEGFYRAAVRWGRCQGENNDLMTGLLPFPWWGLPVHLDPRFQIEWGYSNILSDRDVCEHDFDFLHKNPTDTESTPENPLVTAEEGVRIYTDKMVPYHQDPDRMRMLDYSDGNMYSDHIVRLVMWYRHYTRFYKRAAGLCDWQWPDFVNPYTPDHIGSTGEAEPKFINAVMGTQLKFVDGIELGKKIWTLDNAIWILQGRHRNLVRFADYIYNGPTKDYRGPGGRHLVPCYIDGRWDYVNVNVPERKIDRNSFEGFKTRFYQLEGWDPDTGYPTRKTLQDLGLTDVADELQKRGKLTR